MKEQERGATDGVIRIAADHPAPVGPLTATLHL